MPLSCRAFALLLVAVLSGGLSGCGGRTPDGCTPGMSRACIGAGGCAGSQACLADGSTYDRCECRTVEAGADAAPVPTEGALHVTWTFTDATTCASFPAGSEILVMVIPARAVRTFHWFPCAAAEADILDLRFDDYAVSVEVVERAPGLVLAGSAPQFGTLAASPCDRIVAGDCAQDHAFALSY